MVCAEAGLQVAMSSGREARMRSTVSSGSLLKGIERVVQADHARKQVSNATASIRGIKDLPALAKVWTRTWTQTPRQPLNH